MKKIFFCLALVLQLSMALFSIALAGELENSLIMYASIGDLTSVRNVVEKGANINARDAVGMTALINTVRMGGDRNKDVALFLIEKGADVNAYDKYGRTPLMHAAQAGSVNIVNALIEKGANLNAQDEYGNTALMHAIRSPRADVVRLLIEKGASLNVPDKLGQTALKIARFLKNVGKADFGFGPKQQSEIEEIVRMLERSGAR